MTSLPAALLAAVAGAPAIGAPGAGAPGAADDPGELTEDLIVSAEQIELSAQGGAASGAVRLRWGPWSLRAEAARWDRASAAVSVFAGEAPELGLRFGEASLSGGVLSLSDAALERPELHLQAARMSWDGRRFTVERGALTLCDSAPPPWSLELREGSVDPEGWATARGVWLRLWGRRVLPLPAAAVPVGRVAHPLAPRLGWTDDGLSAAAPVWVPLGGAASLELAPEWRQLRGLRGTAALDLPAGQLEGALGWDTREQALRGAASGAVGRAERAPGGAAWRAAAVGQLASDADYPADFGGTLLDRSVPWLEQRLLAGVGPARAELFSWQDGEDRDARPALVLQRAARPLGPLRLGGLGRLEAAGGDGRAEGALSLEHSADLGPVELNSAAAGRAIAYGGEVPVSAADGVLSASALLPLWADRGGLRHEWAVGAAGSAGGRLGGLLERLPADAPPTPWSAGPVVERRWWGGRTAAVLTAAAPLTPAGPGWSGRARVSVGPWTLALQSDGAVSLAEPVAASGLHGGRLDYSDEIGEAWLGGWVSRAGEEGGEDTEQGRLGAAVWIPGGAGRWRPELELLGDTGSLQEGRVGLGWSSACGCLALTGRAGFAVDRRWPQLGLELQLSP